MQTNQKLIIIHASSGLLSVFPLGAILAPWAAKEILITKDKEDEKLLEQNKNEVMNFQLPFAATHLLLWVLSMASVFMNSMFDSALALPLYTGTISFIIFLIQFFIPLLKAVRLHKGLDLRYPIFIKFFTDSNLKIKE